MSFVLTLLLFFALIAIVPGVVILAAPAKAARAAVGWTIFVIGLIFIDFWTASVAPYDDDGVAPDPSGLILSAWAIVLTIGVGVRSDALFPAEDKQARHAAWGWSIPFGALISVAFAHWLRNRLAGAEPAAWVHGAVLAAFMLAALVAGWSLSRSAGRIVGPLRATLSFAVIGLILVGANIAMGFWIGQRARDFAADRPYCVMTYGGFEARRVAHSGWELSPLVNRHHGVWAIRKTPFLTIHEESGTKSYRYFRGEWRDVTPPRPPCTPVVVRSGGSMT